MFVQVENAGRFRSMSVPLASLFDLTGRVGMVTGGSRGLGLQAAEALGEYGARIALIARKEAELNHAVAHLAELRPRMVRVDQLACSAAGNGQLRTLPPN